MSATLRKAKYFIILLLDKSTPKEQARALLETIVFFLFLALGKYHFLLYDKAFKETHSFVITTWYSQHGKKSYM